MKSLLVVAGEASGDLHGAELLRELKAREPGLRILGVGGAGMTPYLDRKLADVGDLGVVGLVEPLVKIPRLLALRGSLVAAAREEGVGAVLTIDYPGFHFGSAGIQGLTQAMRQALPAVALHHYVCPQVWAWKPGRIPKLGRLLDTLYCLFDFEPPLFEGYPVDARFVGNPLVEVVKPEVDREGFFRETGLDAAKPLVALLPGSRRGELQRLLPPLVGLAKAWAGDPKHRHVQWVLPVAPTLDTEWVKAHLEGAPVRVVEGRSYAARAHADAALVCSGTATLETALLGTPFAILYRLNPITLALARHFVKVPHFGLANVVAGREVAPELLQGEVNPHRLGQELSRLLDPECAVRVRKDLAEVRGHLGEPGAAVRVAEHLLSKLPSEPLKSNSR